MIEKVAFGVITACILWSGLRVVTSRDLVHCVLWLGVSLGATAPLFVILQAPFLAGIQILLYTGGVITLMLFGLMLTRRGEGVHIENERSRRGWAGIIAVLVFAVLVGATFDSKLPEQIKPPATTKDFGRSFLVEHLLAFEVLSLLLLAAMIGAIVLARKRDYGAPGVQLPRKEVS